MPRFRATRYTDALKNGLGWTAGSAARSENCSIHPTAEVADDVEIGPFSVIGPNCRVGPGNRIGCNVTLFANVDLGEGNEIHSGAVIGGLPQDKKYAGEFSKVVIGSANIIRENVTVNSGTKLGGGCTIIGSRNLIMAGCHIAHDCVLEDDITIANNVLLGGHVKVECFASFGGLAAVHHFVTVGEHSFVGGLTRVIQDVPPYMLVEGNPSKIWTINKVGLKRRGFDGEAMEALKDAHRRLFRSTTAQTSVMDELVKQHADVPEVRRLVAFLRSTAMGSSGRARQPVALEEPPTDWISFPARW